MRDSVETKTSSFKGEKTQKAMIDFDTPVHEARRRESDNWLNSIQFQFNFIC